MPQDHLTSSASRRSALLSLSDKSGLEELAHCLNANNWRILSTGGTAKYLRGLGYEITEVADVTGFPEILGGRVKTLHPNIHGALLAKREDPEHQKQLQEFGIGLIDLLVVNLYPFEQTVSNPDATFEQAIENIDVGGPAMLRAAAKNFGHLAVVVDPGDYPALISAIDNGGFPDEKQRLHWAARAFEHVSKYDHAVCTHLFDALGTGKSDQSSHETAESMMPGSIKMNLKLLKQMRYGENSHQQASLYVNEPGRLQGLAAAHLIQGKEMSFNNYADADAAVRCVMEFNNGSGTGKAACVIIKHANPCGVALGDSPFDAYRLAFQCDPTSAFGGIIAINSVIDEQCATAMSEQFAEVIIAAGYSDMALEIFSKKANLRIITLPGINHSAANAGIEEQLESSLQMRTILGGVLVQSGDDRLIGDELKVVSKKQPSDIQRRELIFAMVVAKYIKSNAIVYCKQFQTLGIGAGQMSRIDSAKIAAAKAHSQGFDLQSSVVASDAFFPFRDGVDEIARAGAAAIIHPGGSLRDEEVIQAADEHSMAMLISGIRHFRH